MVCEHLVELNTFIKKNKIAVSSSDLVHFVCTRCQSRETCPSEPFTVEE